MLVEVDDTETVLALQAEVLRRRSNAWAPGLRDLVPAARTLLLDGVDPAAVANEIPTWELSPLPPVDGPVTEIGCHYDGPDIAEVARQWRVDVADVVRVHTSAVHTVAFCGFAPGFAYMTGIGDGRSVARRASPRTAVPAGSVALAGVYTGIYPQRSPGGWQLIGRTDAKPWDPSRDPPALLTPGRRVRFVDLGTPDVSEPSA